MKTVYLWLVERIGHTTYDQFNGFIVAAKSETEASLIHPYGHIWNTERGWNEYGDSSWTNPDNVRVTKIGKAEPTVSNGTVLLTSFKAG